MALEITGKLIQVQPEQTGTGKNGAWVKQEFIVETITEQYPKKICFNAWGEKTQLLKSLKPGTQINVSFNLESRDYNGKWYTDVRAWKIEKATENNPTTTHEPPAYIDQVRDEPGAKDDLPF